MSAYVEQLGTSGAICSSITTHLQLSKRNNLYPLKTTQKICGNAVQTGHDGTHLEFQHLGGCNWSMAGMKKAWKKDHKGETEGRASREGSQKEGREMQVNQTK